MGILRILRGLGALLVLAALLVGTPAALIGSIGSPLPAQLPTGAELVQVLTSPLTDEVITDALACLVWAAWAALAAGTIVEITAEITGRALPRLPGITWARAVTGALIGTIATAAPATAATAATATISPATAARPTPHSVYLQPGSTHHAGWRGETRPQEAEQSARSGFTVPPAVDTAGGPDVRARRRLVTIRARTSAWSAPAADPQRTTGLDTGSSEHVDPHSRGDRSGGPCTTAPRRHTVAPGENLWTIAARHAGPDATEQRIARLVQAIDAANHVIADPSLIRPGWVLTIPPANPPAKPPAAHPHRHDRPPRPHSHQPPTPAPRPTPTTAPTRHTADPSPQPTNTHHPSHHPSQHPGRQPDQGKDRHAHGGFIRLPSGALAGAALAGSVAGALALARARRRRAYTPRHPAPGRGDHGPDHRSGQGPGQGSGLSPVLRRLLTLHHRTRRAALAVAAADGVPAPAAADVGQVPVSMWAGAVAPAHIETGTRDGRPVAIDLLDYGGLAIAGDGAAGCLRGLVAALVGRSGHGVDIVTADLRGGLFGREVANVRRAGRWEDAAAELEAAAIGRARLLAEAGTADFRSHRRVHPEDPLPLICLAVADAPGEATARLAALARSGPRHGIIVLATTSSIDAFALAGMPVLRLSVDGRVRDAAPPQLAGRLGGARMQCLSEPEAREILATLATALHPQPEDEPAVGDEPPPEDAPGTDTTLPDTGPPNAGADAPRRAENPVRGSRIPEPADPRAGQADSGQHRAGPPAHGAAAAPAGSSAPAAGPRPAPSTASPAAPATPNEPQPPVGRHRAGRADTPPLGPAHHAIAQTATPQARHPGTHPGTPQSSPAATVSAAAPAPTQQPPQQQPPTERSEAPARPAEPPTQRPREPKPPAASGPSQQAPLAAPVPNGASPRTPAPPPAAPPPAASAPAASPAPSRHSTGSDEVPGERPRGRPSPPSGPADRQRAANRDGGEAIRPVARPRPNEPAVSLRVLGPVQVSVDGAPIRSGLRSASRELLAYLALRPDGASVAQIVDAMWPDADPEKARRRFWTALGTLRTRLRGPAGDPELRVITQHGDRYTIMPEECGCDVWRFETALTRAAAADDHAGEVSALSAAIAAYAGDFAAEADYLWADAAREDLHRRALDAHVRLAELHAAAGNNQPAVKTLEDGIRLDPLAEDLYVRLMRLYHRIGEDDRARHLFARLREHLADLDVAPSPTTVAILNRINTHARRTARAAPHDTSTETSPDASPNAATDPNGLPPVRPRDR